jgi:hypothetical protein
MDSAARLKLAGVFQVVDRPPDLLFRRRRVASSNVAR